MADSSISSSSTIPTTPPDFTSVPRQKHSRYDGGQEQPIVLLDFFFPGFSVYAGAIQRYSGIDLNLYISGLALLGFLSVFWGYASHRLGAAVESYFMSSVDIRTDDEIYSILMAWVATQKFATSARRFVVNADMSSRAWYLRRYDHGGSDGEGSSSDEGAGGGGAGGDGFGRKSLAYSPSFGTHYFWYRGRLLLFKRNAAKSQGSFLSVSEREEITVSCFGRDPWVIKQLLHEARALYNRRDQSKTLIYRGALRQGEAEPRWQRCLARQTRPFSTVILDEAAKRGVVDDVRDYLDPATQRWYANRGIPYRRGYLLHGPPGTGKSSLSLALAGHFNMRIYIVSLSSVTASEENLTSLFANLPRRCVVLLEDIDTAGLTHTREENGGNNKDSEGDDSGDDGDAAPAPAPRRASPRSAKGRGDAGSGSGRLSLSGLLNILDGVASQEGRVLIMTTNHVDKLDRALIRPGRVDMMVEFGRADAAMTAALFRAIFARLECERGAPNKAPREDVYVSPEERQRQAEAAAREQAKEDARVEGMALEFAARIPAHEFSPAELQGHLLRNKRDPRAAIDSAGEFVARTRRDRQDKELKDAEARRQAEEKKTKEAARKNSKDKKRKEPKAGRPRSEPDPESSSSDADAESEKEKTRKERKSKTKGTQTSKKSTGSDSESSSVVEIENPEKQAKMERQRGDNDLVKSKHEKKDSGYGTPTSIEIS
ncbi:hypothetical protein KJ359_000375 [Pestalotiopsis sp. 9143b]|nr:hypothetical protein KJ359_000375 [Pestalotiopsis sp. 9143b]